MVAKHDLVFISLADAVDEKNQREWENLGSNFFWQLYTSGVQYKKDGLEGGQYVRRR